MGHPGFLGSRVGDRNTERAKARPVPGTAPNALAPYTEETDQKPQILPRNFSWPSSWPALDLQTTSIDKTDKTGTQGTDTSQTHTYIWANITSCNFLNVEPLPRGRPRGGGWAKDSPPLSQIASDLRFAIRITNRNRSQIARFGALRASVT